MVESLPISTVNYVSETRTGQVGKKTKSQLEQPEKSNESLTPSPLLSISHHTNPIHTESGGDDNFDRDSRNELCCLIDNTFHVLPPRRHLSTVQAAISVATTCMRHTEFSARLTNTLLEWMPRQLERSKPNSDDPNARRLKRKNQPRGKLLQHGH